MTALLVATAEAHPPAALSLARAAWHVFLWIETAAHVFPAFVAIDALAPTRLALNPLHFTASATLAHVVLRHHSFSPSVRQCNL